VVHLCWQHNQWFDLCHRLHSRLSRTLYLLRGFFFGGITTSATTITSGISRLNRLAIGFVCILLFRNPFFRSNSISWRNSSRRPFPRAQPRTLVVVINLARDWISGLNPAVWKRREHRLLICRPISSKLSCDGGGSHSLRNHIVIESILILDSIFILDSII